MNNKMTKEEAIELLTEAYENIAVVMNNFPLIKINSNLEQKIEWLKFSNDYNIPLQLLNSSYGGVGISIRHNLFDFRLSSNPCLTNSKTNYKFNNTKKYLIFENSYGRLIFKGIESTNEFYEMTEEIWQNFKKEILNYNPVDCDPTNFTYIFEIKDGIKLYQEIDKIYHSYQKNIDEIVKKYQIKELENQLKKLKIESEDNNE